MTVLLNNLACLAATMYLQRCLMSKRCSMPSLNCRYLDPHIIIKFKAYRAGQQTIPDQEFGNEMHCHIFHNLNHPNQCKHTYHQLSKEANFVFC